MARNRYYADMFDAEEKFYVFDRMDGDSACCGPFNHLMSARGCAAHLNREDSKPDGERPHQIQHRIDQQLADIARRTRRVTGYDTWKDFADILSGRGVVNPDLVPEGERHAIIESYPYGEFDADTDGSDSEWERTGGPWFDKLEDDLAALGYAYRELLRGPRA